MGRLTAPLLLSELRALQGRLESTGAWAEAERVGEQADRLRDETRESGAVRPPSATPAGHGDTAPFDKASGRSDEIGPRSGGGTERGPSRHVQ